MQFKNPEVFYFLILLLIPILVHLFQLQKFVKTPFTNVAFLKKLELQTRKSSRIKKWLILSTRLLGLLAILFAFSQPYFSSKTADKRQHNFIYLDNSLSIDAKGKKGNLLNSAIRDIIENASEKEYYSLLTNSEFYEDIDKSELKNRLLSIKVSPKKQDIATIIQKFRLKLKNNTNSLNNLILISDFQNTSVKDFQNIKDSFFAIKLELHNKNNLSIDSVFVSNINALNFTLNLVIKNQGDSKNRIPIALYNNDNLVSKLSSSFKKDENKTIQFILQNQNKFNGKVVITSSDAYSFDNNFYFTLNNNLKIDILTIGKKSDFLPRIYNKNEFNYTFSSVKNTNYNKILNQQLIILNEIKNIPKVLSKKLVEFSNNGGNIVFIPDEKIDLSSYNSLLKNLKAGRILPSEKGSLKITSINYDHPLFKNVFTKKVNNFQYPSVKSAYILYSKKAGKAVMFENNKAFVSQIKNRENVVHWVASSLRKKNSNFINSPLVVPVFYNFGKMSVKFNNLFYRIDSENKIDIKTKITKNDVLKIANPNISFIPLQRAYQNKVSITTEDQPLKNGFYGVVKSRDTVQKLAYNFPKEESSLNFLDIKELKKQHGKDSISYSISSIFKEISKKNKVSWLWKWFLVLSIVSLLLEILILKFYNP